MESVFAARAFAAKYSYKIDVRQELLGIGSANLLVAFGQGYPVAGGLSQSDVERASRSQDSLIAHLRVDHTRILSGFFNGVFTKLT